MTEQPTVMHKCSRCGDGGPHLTELRTTGVHYANGWCRKCNNHFFPPKPDSDPTKYKRPKPHTDLVTKFSRGFCELCLRKQAQLPKGQTLEAQHVIEFSDGGEPNRENIWIVCTACHRHIHWTRTYHGPREQIAQRIEAIERGEIAGPAQEAGESDADFFSRVTRERQKELGYE